MITLNKNRLIDLLAKLYLEAKDTDKAYICPKCGTIWKDDDNCPCDNDD